MQSILTSIQRLAIQQKTTIISAFLTYEVTVVLLWGLAAWAFITDHDSQLFWFESAANLGVVALCLYCVTLVPGILKRFQLWPQISTSLMLFRRHIGISMFLTGFLHLSIVSLFPVISYGAPLVLVPRTVAGSIGWALLFPLWLTSNDYSVKKLGKTWHLIHKLTYAALFFIFLHVAVVLSKWGLLMGLIIVLELASAMVAWRKKLGLAASHVSAPTVTQASKQN